MSYQTTPPNRTQPTGKSYKMDELPTKIWLIIWNTFQLMFMPLLRRNLVNSIYTIELIAYKYSITWLIILSYILFNKAPDLAFLALSTLAFCCPIHQNSSTFSAKVTKGYIYFKSLQASSTIRRKIIMVTFKRQRSITRRLHSNTIHKINRITISLILLGALLPLPLSISRLSRLTPISSTPLSSSKRSIKMQGNLINSPAPTSIASHASSITVTWFAWIPETIDPGLLISTIKGALSTSSKWQHQLWDLTINSKICGIQVEETFLVLKVPGNNNTNVIHMNKSLALNHGGNGAHKGHASIRFDTHPTIPNSRFAKFGLACVVPLLDLAPDFDSISLSAITTKLQAWNPRTVRFYSEPTGQSVVISLSYSSETDRDKALINGGSSIRFKFRSKPASLNRIAMTAPHAAKTAVEPRALDEDDMIQDQPPMLPAAPPLISHSSQSLEPNSLSRKRAQRSPSPGSPSQRKQSPGNTAQTLLSKSVNFISNTPEWKSTPSAELDQLVVRLVNARADAPSNFQLALEKYTTLFTESTLPAEATKVLDRILREFPSNCSINRSQVSVLSNYLSQLDYLLAQVPPQGDASSIQILLLSKQQLSQACST